MVQFADVVMTTRGDLIRGDANGNAERVALGASGTILQSDGTDAVWSAALAGVTISLNDSDSAFNLTLTSTSTLTAGRVLTLDVDDGARTLRMGGNITAAADFITSGANSLTLTTTGATNVTLPTTGTVSTLAGTETLTNKTLTGNIAVTLVSGAATVTLPTTTATLATLALAETLTSKTLTSPIVGTRTYKEATGTLSQANITGMNGTPVELIAAPGAGKILVVKSVELFHDYAVAAYANGGDIAIEYGGGVDIVLIDVAIATEVADSNRYIVPSVYDLDSTTGTSAGFSVAAHANQNIRVTNATAAFITGDATNVIKWKIEYDEITLLT